MEGESSGSRRHLWLAIAAVALYLAVALWQYVKLRHLPGPYYGGDLYAHHGFALNYFANSLWSDPYFVGQVPFYPWLGNLFFMAFSLLPGVSLMQAEMFIGLVTSLLSAVAFYFLGIQLFRSRFWASVFMLLSLVSHGIPDGAPNLLPWMITIPLWFGFWLRAEETGKLRNRILAGVFMGATALSHVAFFLAGMALFLFTVLVEFLRNVRVEKKQAVIGAVRAYVPMLVVGAAVSLLFYGPIIVKYHARAVNPLFQYNGTDIDLLGIGWVARTLFQNVFNFSTFAAGIVSLLSVLGIIACIMNWNRKMPRYALLWFIAGFLAPLHHLVTRPLFGRWILPSHVFALALPLLVLSVFGLKAVHGLAARKWPAEKVSKAVFVIVLVLFAALLWQRYEEYRANPWTQFGERLDPSTQSWHALGQWMINNTGPNAVVLSGDETCFAMNAVSGRKCVFVRRTHANYFVDVEQRYADGIVMLYGNNSALTDELLEKYSVDFVLIDNYVQQSQVLIEPKYADYLQENNVSFVPVRERKDPSVPNAKVFDMLAVPYQPISQHLQSMLKEAARMHIGQQPFVQLFSVNHSSAKLKNSTLAG